MRLMSLPLCATLVACGISALFTERAASAATVDVWIESVTIPSPNVTTTGSLDVYVTAAASVPVLSYNAEVNLAPTGSGVVFLTPSSNTSSHTPAFPSANFFNNTTPYTIDAANDTTPATSLDNLDGLFQINYQVAANTNGTYNLTFNPGLTFLFDSNNQPVDIALHGGTITVGVPEPASLGMLGLSAALLVRRRRSAR